MNDSVNAVLAEVMATPPAGPLPVDAVVFHPPRSLDKAEQMVKEKETPAIDLLTMFTTALTETINKAVDARVNQIMGNVAMAKFMDNTFEDRVRTLADEIVKDAISTHIDDEPHQDVENAIHDAVSEADWSSHVEKALKYEVNWEDMVDERVREQVEELVPSDDELHDKIREVLNDVTFTVSVD